MLPRYIMKISYHLADLLPQPFLQQFHALNTCHAARLPMVTKRTTPLSYHGHGRGQCILIQMVIEQIPYTGMIVNIYIRYDIVLIFEWAAI
jgi:hypothetical protein